MEIFKHLNDEGRTIIVITHGVDVAQYANREFLMRDGQLMEAN